MAAELVPLPVLAGCGKRLARLGTVNLLAISAAISAGSPKSTAAGGLIVGVTTPVLPCAARIAPGTVPLGVDGVCPGGYLGSGGFVLVGIS